MYTIKIYADKSGRSPFKEWFNRLDSTNQTRVENRIYRVSLGNLGDTKPVGEGVHELRLWFGAGYRIYYGNLGKQLLLLLTGGDKSTQERDIAHAKKIFKEFKDRLKGD